jgi:hypothetical protein
VRKVIWLVLAAAVFGLVGYAFATPSPGPQYRGTLVQPIHANKDGVKVKTRRSTDLIAQDIVYHPGDNSGWHYHPGVVLIEVTGAAGDHLVFHDQHCRTFMIPANSAFYETGHKPGLVDSPSTNTGDITAHAMYILPTGAPPRVNTDPPRCARR